VSLFATILLIVAVLPVLVLATKTMLALAGTGALACLILFSVVGVAVGHMLGGPEAGDRTILALATGTRHPGIAIALTNINFPEQKAVMALVFYHLLVGSIVSIPYLSWQRRVRAESAAGAGTHGSAA
jgi:bile acid:Na+ symporter, BASS family